MSIIEKDDCYSIIAALLWGINYVAVKYVLTEIPENIFLLVRFTISVVLLFIYLAITGEGIRIQRSDAAKILLLGILGVGVYNIFWTVGIHMTTASNAALIVSTSPLFSQLYMHFVNKEKIRLQQWVFTIVAFGGILLMISKSPGAQFNFGSRFFKGNLFVFIGALLFASYTIFAKPLLQRYSPVKLNALAMASGLPLLIAYCALSGPLVFKAVSGMTYSVLFYIVGFGTVAAYISWYTGIKKTGPIKVILFHYIVPVSSMFLGILFLGESVNFLQILGGILALGGVIAAKLSAASAKQANASIEKHG